MTAPRLVHTGGAVVDHVYRIDRLPDPGADRTARSYRKLPGGGFNVMVAARRSGMAAACAGQLGSGPDGDILRAAMAREGIEMLLPPHPTLDSGHSVVLVTDDAERSFVSWPGAEAQPADLSQLSRTLRPGDWVFVTGYSLSYPGLRADLMDFIAALAPEIPLVFDPSPVIAEVPRDALRRILGRATWLSANRAEVATMAAGAADGDRMLLAEMGSSGQGLVLRAGAEGCTLFLRDGTCTELPGFEVEVVDTNGAGDTHVGAFIAALAHGARPEDAARRANAAAAISVTREGGATAPDADTVRAFLADRGTDATRRDRTRQGANH